MKMSHILSGISVVAMTLSTIAIAPVGVNAAKKAQLQDGTYKLEETGYSHGYKAKVSMTVKGHKITKTSYDYVNKKGKSKKSDASYNEQMKSKAGTDPKTYIPKLNSEFKNSKADANNIAVVSGATESSKTFQNYAQQLIQAAYAGKKGTIKIDNTKKPKDGTYKLEEMNYNNGYKGKVSLTFKGGKITKSTLDYVDKNGKSKKDDAKYNETMKSKNGTDPKTYIPKLESELNETKDPAKVQVVSGATHSSNSFVLYTEQLVNAAQAGNHKTIKVDNPVETK